MFTINSYNAVQNISFKEKQSSNILKSKYPYLLTNRITSDILKNYPQSKISLEDLKGKRVLDIGAGTSGTFVNDLRSLGVLADGIDLQIDPFITHMQKGDAQMLPYKDKAFDVIFSTWSLFTHGVENPEIKINALQEVFRVLKPDGKFFCSPVEIIMFKHLIKIAGLENNFIITKSKITDSFFNERWCELTKIK